MPATYSGDPATSSVDAVRFLIGDTDVADALLQDAEITYCVTQKGNVYFAAALAAEAIAGKLGRRYDVGGAINKAQGALAEKFLKLAAELRRRGAESATIYSGGKTIAEKESDDLDSSNVQPDFKMGMDDNPYAGSTTPGDRNIW